MNQAGVRTLHTSLPALTLLLSGFPFLIGACFVSFPRGDLDDPRLSETLTLPGESAETGFLLFKKLLVEEPVNICSVQFYS